MKLSRLLSLFAVLTISGSSIADQFYKLGHFNGLPTVVTGGNKGFAQLVGTASSGSSAAIAFVWTPAHGFTPLPGQGGYAHGLFSDQLGDVIVGDNLLSPGYWDPAINRIALLLGAKGGSATGVDALGDTIVGTQAFSPTGVPTEAFEVSKGSTSPTPLGGLPGWSSSAALGISGDGKTIFGLSNSGFPPTPLPAIYTHAGGWAPVEMLTGYDEGTVVASNPDASTLVGFNSNSQTGVEHAFRYKMHMYGSVYAYEAWTIPQILDLGLLNSAYPSSTGTSVTDDGCIVVGASKTGPASTDYEAFIYDLVHGMRKLSDWLTTRGLGSQLSGVRLLGAAISGDGSAICGTLLDSTGKTQGYVVYLTPDPPLVSFTAAYSTVIGGEGFYANEILKSIAPPGDSLVHFQCPDGGFDLSRDTDRVLVGRSSSSNFTVFYPDGVDAAKTSTVTAQCGGASKSLTFTIVPAKLQTVFPGNPLVVGGKTTTIGIELWGLAGPSGLTVKLSSNDVLAVPQSTVTIPYRHPSGAGYVYTKPVAVKTVVTISASARGKTLTTNITLVPPSTTSVTLSKTSIVGGNAETGTVHLNGIAPPNGMLVFLASSSSLATTPLSVRVPAGYASAAFLIRTSGVSASKAVTITAATTILDKVTATLTLDPAALSINTLSQSAAKGGYPVTWTIYLNGAAPPGGFVLDLSSDNTAAQVPHTVTIPQGATSTKVTVVTIFVSSIQLARLEATHLSESLHANLDVTP